MMRLMLVLFGALAGTSLAAHAQSVPAAIFTDPPVDLAQAVRRAGWNAVTFNYRGSWGSPGVFRFGQNTEDAAGLVNTPLLALTADDAVADHTVAFVGAGLH
jgi:hypothetical protein